MKNKTQAISNSCDRLNQKNVTSSSDQHPGRDHLGCTQVVNTSRKSVYDTQLTTWWGKQAFLSCKKDQPAKVMATLLVSSGQYLNLTACWVPAAMALLFRVRYHPTRHSLPHGHGHTKGAVPALRSTDLVRHGLNTTHHPRKAAPFSHCPPDSLGENHYSFQKVHQLLLNKMFRR